MYERYVAAGRAVLTVLVASATAGCSDAGGRPSEGDGARTFAVAESGGIHVETAMAVTRQYLEAMAEGRGADMRALLAPGPRSDATLESLAASGSGVAAVSIRELVAELAGEERIVLRARLHVALDAGAESDWAEGANERWVELVRTRAGWRVLRIAGQPIADPPWVPVTAWAQAHVMEGQLSIDVPNAWARRHTGWIWAPNASGLPEVGVEWRDAPADWDPVSIFAGDARILARDSLGVGWRPGTMFTLEVPDPVEGPAAVTYEKHVIVRNPDGGRVYDFFGRARTQEELRWLLPVLRRMSASASRDSVSLVSVRARRID